MFLTPDQQAVLLSIARETIYKALGRPIPPCPPCLDPLLGQPAGCFVSLHEISTHRLRGCVGRIDADDSLIDAVRLSAKNVLNDPRFAHDRVRLEELPRLELEISILSALTPAGHPLDFSPLEDGIYLRIDQSIGCFLPQVARETGWTRQQLLARLCTEKMDLPPDAWQRSSARLSRFTCQIIGPSPFDPV